MTEVAQGGSTGPDSRDAEDEPSSSPAIRLLVQFFVVPALVVGIGFGIFWLFGSLAIDKKTPDELLADVRTASRNERWQSAFELTRRLPTDEAARVRLGAEVIRAYEGASNDDPRVRRYLALILGRLGTREAVPVLERALLDNDAETRLYALWSLALIAESASATKVRPALSSEDPGTRKTAAYALGRMGDRESIPELTRLLSDSVTDVRWNAALALATLGDPAGRDVLAAMADRAALAAVPGITPDQMDEALLNGLRGLLLLKDPRAEALAKSLRETDPSVRVRRQVLELTAPPGGKP